MGCKNSRKASELLTLKTKASERTHIYIQFFSFTSLRQNSCQSPFLTHLFNCDISCLICTSPFQTTCPDRTNNPQTRKTNSSEISHSSWLPMLRGKKWTEILALRYLSIWWCLWRSGLWRWSKMSARVEAHCWTHCWRAVTAVNAILFYQPSIKWQSICFKTILFSTNFFSTVYSALSTLSWTYLCPRHQQ